VQDFRAAVQELWSKAVLAGSSVEELADDLVARMRERLTPEAARELAAEVARRIREHRRQLADEVEACVRRTLRLPDREQLARLGERIDEIEARIAKLSGKENSPG
jgi:polyhydroxyalkanoate synthesis regulator phasin